jgi:glycosyltransferase involved in cell wall biosynthesis
MKIAMLVPGGVDRSGTHRVIPCLLWLIERLARQVELHVFALRQEPARSSWTLLGARVHQVGGPVPVIGAVTAVATEHRRAPFDALHAVWATPGAPGAVLARALGRPLLLHLTGGDLSAIPEASFGLRSTVRGRALLRVALSGARRVTTPSASMVRAAARLGISAERLPLGVDRSRWPIRPPRPRDPDQTPRLIHVASLNRVKDQPTLLRAVRELIDRGHGVHLDVVGEDTLGGAVQSLAQRLGLGRAVTFHGFLPHGELRPLVERAHMHVVSSLHEADPTALLEAAVCGVPTAGTSVGHLVDWAPEAAVAAPVGDPPALANAIEELLRDDDRRLEVARAAQDLAAAEDADWTAARVLGIYREMTGSRARVR